MNRLLTSNLARHRLARTVIQGIIGGGQPDSDRHGTVRTDSIGGHHV